MGLLSPSPRPGERLRSLRASVGLTIREVERRSQKLAETKGNPDYLVSHSWLRSIEQGEFTPSIYKFYSLSVIYHRGCEELLSFFGIQFADVGKDQGMFDWPATHVVGASVDTEEGRIPFPVRLRPDFHPGNTNLLTRLVQVWGTYPLL